MFKLIVMFKLFSIFSISSLFQGPEVSRSIFTFMIGIACAFRAVYRRTLSTIGTTLMLAAFLSACGGGGGGSSDAPTPAVPTLPTLPTTPTFSISSSNLSVDEDFAPSRIVASVSNATAITVRQSNNGVVNITNSNAQVDVSSILHANGRTVLTIRATNGTFTATTQVTVTVNAVNDPPTLAISSNSISTVSGFSSITINTTATDVEDTNLIFTVMDANTGVITVTQSTNAIVLNAIAGASGQTTLTVSLVDSSGTTVTQTIAVNVTIAAGAAPVLLVSTNRINVQEDFGTPVVIRTTVTDSDSTTLTLTVTSSMRLVDVEISTRTDNLSTITLTTIANLNGTATLSFRATDDGGQTNSTEIVVVVAAVNDTPTLTVPTATLIVVEDFDGTNSVATFADVDRGDALTVTVTESTTGVVTVTTSASGVSVSSNRNVNGKTTLTISLSDGRLSTTAQVVVDVTVVNDPPTLSVSSNSITTVSGFSAITINTTASDIEDANISFTVIDANPGVVTVTTLTNAVVLNTIAGATGLTTLTVRVVDSSGATVTETITVSVSIRVSAAPVVTVSTNLISVPENFRTPVIIQTTATDSDATDTITVSVSASQPIVTALISTPVNGQSTITNRIILNAIADANGTATLTVFARDTGGQSHSTEIVVVVRSVEDAPTLTIPTATLIVAEDFTSTLTIATANDDDPLLISVVESTTGIVTVTTSASGVFVSSILNANGQTTLTITVSDGTQDTKGQVVINVTPINDPPTLSVSSNSITIVGGRSPITINTTASDIEDVNLSFTVIDANTGVVTVTTSTNAIVLNTISGASGQTTLTVSVVDSSGATVTEIIAVNVSITVSVAPVVTVSTRLISVPEDFGTSVIVQTTATDSDATDTITVSVSASMPIVTAVISTPVNGQSTITNRITITAIGDANGTATLTVLARDAGGQSHSTEIVVVVSSVQDTPTLTIPSATLTVAEDFMSTLTIATARDGDGDPLLISVVESTTGIVTVTTSASGVFVSSIGNANGQTTLTITVNDGTQDTTGQVVMDVTPVNDPPVLSVSTNALTLVENFVPTILIGTTRTDTDSTALTFTVAESTTGVVSVTVTDAGVQVANIANTAGRTTLTFTLSDGRLNTTTQVMVNITAINSPPVLTVSTTAITLVENFSGAILIGTTRTDIDSTTLTLTVAESTTGVVTVTVTDAGVQIANTAHAAGRTTLTITLSDGKLSSTAQVVVTLIEVNTAPLLLVLDTFFMVQEDFNDPLIIRALASDLDDNDTITISVSSTSRIVDVAISTFTNGLSIITLSSIPHANGTMTLTVQAVDAAGARSVPRNVVVVVSSVNDPPVLNIPSATLTRLENFVGAITVATASDMDVDPLIITVVESRTGVVRVTTSATDVRISSLGAANGVTTLSISVSDGKTVSSTAQVVVTVTPVNDPPALFISANTLTLIEDFVTTEVIVIVKRDVDGDTLTLTVSESTTGVVNFAPISAGLQIVSILNANGQTTLTITLSDGRVRTTAQVVVDVTAVNDTPTLTISTNALTLNEDFGSVIIATIRSDVEGDTLTLTVAEYTTGVVTVQTTTSGVSVFSIAHKSGRTTLTITLSDGDLSTTTKVVVDVTPVNDAPTFSIPSATLTVAEDFASTLTIATANDVDGDTLTITVAESSTGIVTVTTSASSVQIESIHNVSGQTTLMITVSDNTLKITTQVVVTVTAVNDSPVLSVSTNTLTLLEDFATVFIATTRTDIDSTTLTLTVAESATGVVTVLTSTSGVSVSKIDDRNGRTTLTITLSDDELSTTTQVVVDVTPVNDSPVVSVSTTALTLNEDFIVPVLIGITATDADNDTITLSVSSSSFLVDAVLSTLTNGMSTLTLTAIANADGTTTLTVEAMDATGLSVSTNVVVFVAGVNFPPTLNIPSTTLTILEDFVGAITVATANDVDVDALTFTVVESSTGVVRVTTSTTDVRISSLGEANGVTTLSISVSDDSTVSLTTQVVVTVRPVNDPPALTISTTALTLLEDFTTAVIVITKRDVDGDTLTLTVSDTSATFDLVRVTTTASNVQVASILNANGQTTLTIALSDGQTTTSAQVAVSVVAVNDPPTFILRTTSILSYTAFTVSGTPEVINFTIVDVEDGSLTPTVSNSTPGLVTVTAISTTAVSVNFIVGASGQTVLTVRAVDSSGTAVTRTIPITVLANIPPTLMASTTLINVQRDFTNSVSFRVDASDLDGDTITLSVSSTTHFVNVAISTLTGGSISNFGVSVTLSAIANAFGITTLTFQAIDTAGQSVSTNVVVVVNAPPELAVSTTNLTLLEDFATPIFIRTTRTDIDSKNLTFTVSESTTGVVRVIKTTSGIQVANIANANGRTTLTVSLSDGKTITSVQVSITVVAVYDPPTLSVSTNLIVTLGGFTPIIIHTTATVIDNPNLAFTVVESLKGIVTVTQTKNAIVLNTIPGAYGQTRLLVSLIDSSGTVRTQTILVFVTLTPSAAPTLLITHNFIHIYEDVRDGDAAVTVSAADSDSSSITLTVTPSTRLVNFFYYPNALNNVLNEYVIVFLPIKNLYGTATMTVRATDDGGETTSTEVVIKVSPVPTLSFSTSVVSLSVPGSQLDRIVNDISIGNPENKALRAQIRITARGDPIFSADPAPMVSFTTNTLTTTATLTSTTSTAQLYFTIAPNRYGRATLIVQLTDLDTLKSTEQTMVVHVDSVAKPPVITYVSTNIANIEVHGGRLYANSVSTAQAITSFLPEAKALGGHLININTVEEFNFVYLSTNSIMIDESWIGLVLPQLSLPGELSWVTDNSTVAYGFVSTTVNTTGSVKVYPGHYNLNWHSAAGLIANRNLSRPSVFNWTIYAQGLQGFYLANDSGDQQSRHAIYELHQGLTPVSMMPKPSIAVLGSSSATVSLTGFDMNGDAITTAHWSATDPGGGTVRFNATYQGSGVQTVEMVYTPDPIFDGPTTVVVTLQVNGLSTTAGISLTVDAPPIVALSTNTIVLNEDFSPFVIGTTVTDGLSRLSYTVQASTSGVLTITTTTNAIRLTPIAHVSGTVTLTVQATDSTQQTVSTEVVVTVRAVNDPPTLSISSDSISTLGGFFPITINTTATDVEDGALSFSVQVSTTGIVGISTSVNTITLSPLLGRSGQTTLTVSAIDTSNTTVVRTIAVNVIVVPSTTPVLTVSTNLIRLQEDFATVVIGTTATDADTTGALLITVSSSTHLVNTMISTRGITLNSGANLFGTATLTVRAPDAGGVFDSTEIVVIVTPVNDTPTLTVSMHTVALGSVPIVLNVSASDVEDGILAFGASSGQNLVRATVTTTSLTLSRLDSRASTTTLTISTTDTAGVKTSTQIVVTLSAFFTFTVTTGIKTLDFAWSALSNATHYQLRSNPDGNSGFVDLTTTGVVVSPNSTMIRQTTAQARVSLRHYIPKANGPQYAVNICTTTPCGSSFQHNSVALTNAQLNNLIGRLQASNGEIGDLFGASVRISGDGNTLVVAATGELSLSTGVNGVQNNNGTHFVGAVYIFRRNGSDWSQQAYIKALYADNRDNFGASIDLSDDGNILAVGAYGESGGSTGIHGAQDLNNATNSGAAYVFRFSGGVWSQQAYIKAPISQGGVYFGIFVSLSGDGNTLAVGEYLNDSGQTGVNDVRSVVSEVNSGAAYVFRFSGGVWSQQAYIKASNTGRSDNFGEVVSLSSDGNTLAVAAPAEAGASTGIDGVQSSNAARGAGAVYLFRFSGGAWSQQAYIKASNTQADDRFGQAMSLSRDGNTLVVSALNEDGASTGVNGLQSGGAVRAGAAYLFRFSGGAWSQQAYIKASNTGDGDRFGRDVSLSADGNTLAVGGNLEDSSASSVGGDENNDSSSNSGAVYVFEFRNGIWSQQAYIKSNPNVTGAFFGSSVHLSNDGQTLVVGGSGGSVSEGAVYLY